MNENWRKSSRCDGGTCTEVAAVPGAVLVRDSTDRGGTVLAFAAGTWRAAIAAWKGGAA